MKKILIIFLTFSFGNLVSQTTVNSLEALLPYLDDSNANVKLSPGTYSITAADVAAGNFSNPLFLFEGNNSIYDFTGVTINFDTDIFMAFGNVGVEELKVIGNNNVLKNLKMVDVGSVYDRPTRTALGISLQGQDNLIEGFDMTIVGSQPYGYGDAFGKGSGYVIKHFKHSAILVGGDRNHVKDCNIKHRAYGHGVFMQGAVDALIEGVYLEGEVRSTDDMLAGAYEGAGTTGEDVNWITVWGFPLPAGHTMSLQEDGIRTYTRGTTIINGETISDRRTTNITIKDCTIKKMRSGCSITLTAGTKYIENTTAISCETGFGAGNGGQVVNCFADAAIGPVYRNAYNTTNNFEGDITVIPPENGYYNGANCLAYLGGNNHEVILRNAEPNLPSNLAIMFGGDFLAHRFLSDDTNVDHPSKDISLINYTTAPVLISSESSGNQIETCSTVTNNGSNNSISQLNDCDTVPPPSSSFTPDPNKTYYIDNPYHNLRLASNGSSEDAYTTSTQTTGDDVTWKFVDKGNGFWHIQRAAGGTKPRLRTDNSELADMQAITNSGTYTYYDFTQGASANTHFITLPDGPSGRQRLQINNSGLVRFMSSSLNGTWESFNITEINSTNIVHITKRNAPNFAIDGMGGGANGQNVYLWSANENNDNQQWLEIDRGNGYYSYQKVGTNYCIDGNNQGTNRQNVYLWSCEENNQNQQWQKVAVGGGAYKLIKRNAPGYALDGGSNGTDGQNIQLYDASSLSQNLQWIITPINDTKSPEITDENIITLYPNPVVNTVTIKGATDTIITIYDIKGSEVLTKSISSDNETIDLGHLDQGLYHGKVRNNTTSITLKIVKN
ncbi:RICIN domain-containing protein [Aquimarina sp. Aq107]|uniref:RICIN domain-containing protein n=1 Tax=Aquimarina sp. Aq107 TaxID=1191912 RepID=UPI0020B1FDA3|nr:RICIN domain-containing protein [Aquimarina sp. Aq107]